MLMQANAIQIPMKNNSVDCVVTDSPYGLEFMGMAWDTMRDNGKPRQRNEWGDFGSREHARHPSQKARIQRNKNLAFYDFSYAWATEVFRVMKPGAMMFCFGGTRTHHRLMCAIEDAGFEIRDCLMWLYGSGFPKSLDISKAIQKERGVQPIKIEPASGVGFMRPDSEDWHVTKHKLTMPKPKGIAQAWDGQGTALKPAWEPIILAMKPLDGTFAQNALKWGVAGLNIDAGRIEGLEPHHNYGRTSGEKSFVGKGPISITPSRGRWPANVILDEEAVEMLDGQSGTLKAGGSRTGNEPSAKTKHTWGTYKDSAAWDSYNDSGGASRFFYCAKASRAERNAGLERLPEKPCGMMEDDNYPIKTGSGNLRNTKRQNYHPTVKPLALVEYLVGLGSRPGHIILDPFVGSGTTIIACDKLNRTGIGLDLSYTYLSEIAKPRQDVPLQRVLM